MKKILSLFFLLMLLVPMITVSAKPLEVPEEDQELLTQDRDSWKRFKRDIDSTNFFIDTESVERTGDMSFQAIFKKDYFTDSTDRQVMIMLASRKGVATDVFLAEFYIAEDGKYYTVQKVLGYSSSGEMVRFKNMPDPDEVFAELDLDAKDEYKIAMKYLPKDVQNEFKEYEKNIKKNK